MNIRNFCIIAHIDHGKSTLADRMLELTKTIEDKKMRAQLLDQMDLERERGITIKLQPVRMLYKTQIKADSKTDKNGLLYENLSYKVRGAIFNVYNQLGPGFKEKIYQNALEQELLNNNIPFVKEKSIEIFYDNKKVGTYKPDFIVDGKIILELKALPFIGKLEKKQTWHYLKGSDHKLALLVNFGQTKLQIERIIYNQLRSAINPISSEFILNLIDTPGHVDFSYEVSRTLAAVEGAILLIDATQGIQAQTLANLYQAQKQNLDIIPVINKIDLANARIEETKKEVSQLLEIDENDILSVSAKTGEGVKELLEKIILKIRPPVNNPEKPLRALIFDSVYDTYKGVVAYVRIFDGQIKKNEKIKFLSNNKIDDAIEVGYFNPKFRAKDDLISGEIGYIMTGLKDIKSAKVGDTITKEKDIVEALPGYKKVKPMVYAEFYSKDGDVNKLREALEKLSLNDSSLYFEPQSSKVFGFGFKCGFLGLLHLEIIKERLMREYNLDLVITTPKVDYKTELINSKVQYIEPWVSLEIVTPSQYIGPIMNLTTEIRGKYLDTKYLSDRAIIYFEAPLANIITNYYDKLKSVSSGYASLNYEFLRYQKEDLIKMDILLAEEKIDAFSQIVHKNELLSRAKNMVKKLKESLPKQSFKIIIQAAVGGKIIAREDISALKKDVTGHLYGGDISRKKKLWKKQAEGKKKMQKMGKVDIPTDVFIKILK